MNALYMVASAIAAMAIHAMGGGVVGVFVMVAFGNAWIAGLALRRLAPAVKTGAP